MLQRTINLNVWICSMAIMCSIVFCQSHIYAQSKPPKTQTNQTSNSPKPRKVTPEVGTYYSPDAPPPLLLSTKLDTVRVRWWAAKDIEYFVKELKKDKIEEDTLITIVDVRPLESYVKGHIPGSVNIPLDQISTYLPFLGRYFNGTIIFVCDDGKQSRIACGILVSKGFSDEFTRYMKMGISGWTSEKLPLVTQ